MTFFFFFLNDPAPPEIYPLPLHDALPICPVERCPRTRAGRECAGVWSGPRGPRLPVEPPSLRADAGDVDRKSTRLNSSHLVISYAVFCLKKKNKRLQAVSLPQSTVATACC